MGSVIIREKSQVGDAYSSVEYEFSDSVDFLAWQADKDERVSNALKSFVEKLDQGDEPMYADIQVKKKETIN